MWLEGAIGGSREKSAHDADYGDVAASAAAADQGSGTPEYFEVSPTGEILFRKGPIRSRRGRRAASEEELEEEESDCGSRTEEYLQLPTPASRAAAAGKLRDTQDRNLRGSTEEINYTLRPFSEPRSASSEAIRELIGQLREERKQNKDMKEEISQIKSLMEQLHTEKKSSNRSAYKDAEELADSARYQPRRTRFRGFSENSRLMGEAEEEISEHQRSIYNDECGYGGWKPKPEARRFEPTSAAAYHSEVKRHVSQKEIGTRRSPNRYTSPRRGRFRAEKAKEPYDSGSDEEQHHRSEERGQYRRRRSTEGMYNPEAEYRPHSSRNRHITLEKFDGTTPLDVFLDQFETVAEYNDWSSKDKAVHLKTSLKGGAAQLVSSLCPGSRNYKEMIEALKRSYAASGQESVYTAELRTLRRRRGEPLNSLYQNVARLMGLAFPGGASLMRDRLGVEYFLDALDDESLRFRVCERSPNDLESAYYIALNLEAYERSRRIRTGETDIKGAGRARSMNADVNLGHLQMNINEVNNKVDRLEQQMRTPNAYTRRSAPLANTFATRNQNNSNAVSETGRKIEKCYICESTSHFSRNCPQRNTGRNFNGRSRYNFNSNSFYNNQRTGEDRPQFPRRFEGITRMTDDYRREINANNEQRRANVNNATVNTTKCFNCVEDTCFHKPVYVKAQQTVTVCCA